MDLVILATVHVVLLPLWVAIWVMVPFLIWIEDRGPIFFRQSRCGIYGKPFTLLKFRTMTSNSYDDSSSWTEEENQRITRVGKILRKTAIDEIPGLISIWKGDMTLVGPRALSVVEQAYLETEVSGFSERLKIVPGLTGLAQIFDHLDVAEDKLRYDLEYIERMSVGLDLLLLIMSVKNTLLGRWDNREGKIRHPNR